MNNKVFIVVAELNKISSVKEFENQLGFLGEWVKVTNGVYFLKEPFDRTSENIIENMLMTERIKIFVMKTSLDAAWYLENSLDEWLKKNI